MYPIIGPSKEAKRTAAQGPEPERKELEMLWDEINTNEVNPGEALIAETRNNTYVVMAHFRGEVQIVFESYKRSDCIRYAERSELHLLKDVSEYADVIPAELLDRVERISVQQGPDKVTYAVTLAPGWLVYNLKARAYHRREYVSTRSAVGLTVRRAKHIC